MRSRPRLGKVLHVSRSSGNLILKAGKMARIGAAVLDSAGRRVGTLFDIFGPVSNPFAAVKPEIDEPGRYVGELIFLGRSKR